MRKASKPMEWARNAVENNQTVLTVFAIIIGLSLRYIADPHSFTDMRKEGLKEIGTFILVTFVVAFIYENFINYKFRHEFVHDLEIILTERFHLPLSKVFPQRPELNDKVALMMRAQKEIIECGTALRTYSSYLASDLSFHTPSGETGRYRQFIEQRLKDGVNVTCLMLDPIVAATLKDLEPGLEDKIKASWNYLKKFSDDLAAKKYRGKFQIIFYTEIPRYAAICIDGDDPVAGAMLMSPYIPGLENAETPAFLLERQVGTALFERYWQGVKACIASEKTQVPPVATNEKKKTN